MLRLLAVLSLALGACSSTGPAFERLEHPPALAAERVELRLADERPSVSKTLHVSVWTLPGDGQELSPPLDPGLQAALERTLRMHVVHTARQLRIEVRVLEAVGSWSANVFSETVKGTARVSVRVFDSGADRLLVQGEGASWAVRTLVDVSDKGVIEVVGMALQAAVFEFLESEPARAALAVP